MGLTAGTKLGPYEILSPLGAGGMGEVYCARDTRLDRKVAIKILSASLSDNPDARQRFQREGKAISSLQHPNICTLYDIGSENGIDFLVMEYLEGETLQERLLGGSLPLEQVARFAMEIADALAFEIHQHIRRTAVYQRNGAHWQLIQSASVALPNADRKQKPVDGKILDRYVGLYEGNLRITRDGNRILSQDPTDKEKVELLAVTDNSFVIANESDSVLFVFEQGPDGRTQIRAHNVGGSEEVIKRID